MSDICDVCFSPDGGGGDSALSSRLATVYQELEVMEADKAPAKAAMILAGLGFSPDMQRQVTRYNLWSLLRDTMVI